MDGRQHQTTDGRQPHASHSADEWLTSGEPGMCLYPALSLRQLDAATRTSDVLGGSNSCSCRSSCAAWLCCCMAVRAAAWR
jgi:hypothetical protein